MKLLDLLAPDRILVPIGGETLSNAIAELVSAMQAAGTVDDPVLFEELVSDTLAPDPERRVSRATDLLERLKKIR